MKSVQHVLQKLPSKFQPEAAKDLSIVFQFVIDESLRYSLTVKEQQCQLEQQDHPDPDVTLFMGSQTFVDIIQGDLGGTSAFMNGSLRAEGNIMLATKLSALFKR